MKNSLEVIQDRRDRIMAYVNNRQKATVNELSSMLNVTSVTIRKDLDDLAMEKKIKRCFGGAERLSDEMGSEEHVDLQNSTVRKRALAKRAAELLDPDDVVLINSSTTVSYVVEYVGDKPMTIISNNTDLIIRKRNPNTILLMTGGQLLPGRSSMSGAYAIDILKRNHATKCVIGVRGISFTSGITSSVLEEATINRLMVSQTVQGGVIVAAPSMRIGRNDSFPICGLDQVSTLITDAGIRPLDKDRFEDMGIQVIVVDHSSRYSV